MCKFWFVKSFGAVSLVFLARRNDSMIEAVGLRRTNNIIIVCEHYLTLLMEVS